MLSEQGRMQVARAMTTSTYNMYIHEGVSTKLNPAGRWIDITLAKMAFQSLFSKYETVPSFFCTLLQDKLNPTSLNTIIAKTSFRISDMRFHILVEILGSCKQFAILWDFLIEVRDSSSYDINSEIFWLIFKAGGAIRSFHRMYEFGVLPTVHDFDKLLLFMQKEASQAS
ncbi:Pentatricopeptide repeat-containing protein [Vigna angularis]|uniref:Pentatricopeptide repeat-containing protein n=2 Tax=Phaseolus angularis TaxID=3914 RepID=A0A8T0KS14_PHAAN|nr:Pentatricopeptide repeat-containing protein [Vigna angularis]